MIDLILLSMIGILGGLANLWLSQSYKLSEVSLVSPLKYLALIFAIIFGYLIWDENTYFKNPNRSFVGNFFFIYNI
jgi:drug/metabolite transporter (DMT)-like permease